MRLLLGLVAAALLTVVSVSFGQSSADTTVSACVKKKGGAVRVARKCRHGEARVSWNRRGPAGPQGPQGPQGAGGARGSFSFDQIDGMRCEGGTGSGAAHLSYDSQGWAQVQC